MKLQSYRQLEVWQLGIALVRRVYKVTRSLPSDERYGLCSQLQRAAVSVPSNIAEGWSQTATRLFLRYLAIARGSLAEVETLLVVTQELSLVPAQDLADLSAEAAKLGRMLNALEQSLRRKIPRQPTNVPTRTRRPSVSHQSPIANR